MFSLHHKVMVEASREDESYLARMGLEYSENMAESTEKNSMNKLGRSWAKLSSRWDWALI